MSMAITDLPYRQYVYTVHSMLDALIQIGLLLILRIYCTRVHLVIVQV